MVLPRPRLRRQHVDATDTVASVHVRRRATDGLLIECLEHLLQSHLEGRVAVGKPIPRSLIFENTASARTWSASTGPVTSRIAAAGHSTHAQRRLAKTRRSHRELAASDWQTVHEEIPAARVAVLGQMHQGAGAVVDVNGLTPNGSVFRNCRTRRPAITGSITLCRNQPASP